MKDKSKVSQKRAYLTMIIGLLLMLIMSFVIRDPAGTIFVLFGIFVYFKGVLGISPYKNKGKEKVALFRVFAYGILLLFLSGAFRANVFTLMSVYLSAFYLCLLSIRAFFKQGKVFLALFLFVFIAFMIVDAIKMEYHIFEFYMRRLSHFL